MKKVFIIFAVVIIIGAFILLLVSAGKKSPQALFFGGPTPTPVVPSYSRNIDFSGIFSDAKTQEQITSSLASPSSQATQGNYTVTTFAQPDDSKTVLYTKGQKATYVEKSQSTDNTTYTEFKNAHPGVSEYTLYDPKGLSQAGFEWRVFPDEGVAYLTNVQSGFVMTTLYFVPTSYQSFLSTAGKDFSLQKTDPAGNQPESIE